MTPPTPTELDAAIERLGTIANIAHPKYPAGPVTIADLRLVLTALRDARKDGERLVELSEYCRWATLESQCHDKSLADCWNRLSMIFHAGYKLYSKYDLDGTQGRNAAMSARSDEKGRD